MLLHGFLDTWRTWGGELGAELEPGTFGENLTVRGIPVSAAVIGERWVVGSTLLGSRSSRALHME